MLQYILHLNHALDNSGQVISNDQHIYLALAQNKQFVSDTTHIQELLQM